MKNFCVVFVSCASTAITSSYQTFQTHASFNGTDGNYPLGNNYPQCVGTADWVRILTFKPWDVLDHRAAPGPLATNGKVRSRPATPKSAVSFPGTYSKVSRDTPDQGRPLNFQRDSRVILVDLRLDQGENCGAELGISSRQRVKWAREEIQEK
jgi:hypothetical protein